MPQHALPARLPLLRASDAVARSHYFSLPGVIEHTSWGHVSERAMALQIARHLPDASDQRWALGTPTTCRRSPRSSTAARNAVMTCWPATAARNSSPPCERLRAAVETAALPAAEAHVTISIGVAWQAAHEQAEPRGRGTALRPPGLDRAQHRRAMQVPRATLHTEAGHGLQKLR